MSNTLSEAARPTRADASPPGPTAAAVGPVASGYRYWAFISYSHRDGDWAARIHRRLETWRVPRNLVGRATPAGPVPRRLFPIFRDRDELAGGSDVDDVLKAALKQSRYLVVLCSPNAAGSRYVADEVCYFKSLGRDDRIVYVILDGDPSVADVGAGTACFPPVARQRVGPDCRPVAGGRAEPMAADARPGKDGIRDAMTKVKARLLAVPFDELKRREARRRRRARAALASLGFAAASLVGAAYVGVADAGLAVPGGASIRAALDRHEASVFRRVADDAAVRRAAAKLSDDLQTALRARFTKDGLINDSPPRESPSIAYIAHAQGLSALLSGNGDGGVPFAADVARLERLFRPGLLALYPDGVKCGWINDPAARDVDAFTPLWAAIAICEALQSPEARAGGEARARLLAMLAYTQESLRPFRHDAEVPGAWDAFPFQTDGRRHSVYASTVALLALCEARRADVPWDGSAAMRDDLARLTAAWIIGQYRGAAGGRHGWLNDPYEEHAADVFDGMTAQTYSALLDAQATFPGVTLPPSMLDDVRVYLSEAVSRSADYPIDVGEYRMEYRRPDGTLGTARETLRYLWWPWVVRTGDLWLRYAAGRPDLPNEYRVQVRRTLAHLVLDLGPAQNEAALNGYSYINSENLFGLRGLGQP